MYFEIDDIKRRHSPYFDVYNVHGWINPPEDFFAWHWFRGGIAGVTGAVVNAFIAHKYECYKTLRARFHPPETFAQVFHFSQAIKEVANYEAVD